MAKRKTKKSTKKAPRKPVKVVGGVVRGVQTQIHPGGLMRCCLHYLAEKLQGDKKYQVNDRVTTGCRHAEDGEQVVVLRREKKDFVWRWEGEYQ